MKKFCSLALLLACTTVFSLTSCGQTAQTEGSAASNSGNSEEQSVTIIAAHASTEENSMGQFMIAVKDYIESHSDSMTMQIYPAGQLGSDTELAESVQEGSIQVACGSTGNYISVFPELCIFDLPFAYNDYYEMREIFGDPDLVAAVDAAAARNGLKIGCIRTEGFRTLFSKEAVVHPGDIDGLSLRVMDNKYHLALWQELGANVTTVAFTELYTALQQGVVQAQENTVSSTMTNYNLYEVTNFATNTKHIPTVHTPLINLEFYNSLSPEQQQVLIDAFEYARVNEEDLQAADLEYIDQLKSDYGYEYYEFTEEDLEECRAMTQDAWDMVMNDSDPEIYSALQSAIEKQRGQ